MRLRFLLPEINSYQTGGNIYNRQVLDFLRERAEVEVVYQRSGRVELPAAPADVTLIDSLLLTGATKFFPSLPENFVLLLHYLPELETGRFSEWRWLSNCRAILCTSRYTQNLLQGRVPLARENIGLAEPGLTEGFFEPLPARETEKQINMATFANLLPNKQFLEAMEMLAGWPERDWQWHIRGESALQPAYAAEVERQINSLQLGPRIMLHPPVAPEKVPALLDEADLFILPSRFESYGMAVAEAAARGKRIVAFKTGGLPTTLQGYPAVYWAKAGDWTEFLEALQAAVADLRRSGGKSVGTPPGWRFNSWRETGQALWAFLNSVGS